VSLIPLAQSELYTQAGTRGLPRHVAVVTKGSGAITAVTVAAAIVLVGAFMVGYLVRRRRPLRAADGTDDGGEPLGGQ
jgi:hypothetical protein